MAQCLANIDFMLKINIRLTQQCVCITKCRHILLHYISLKPLLKMIHGLIHWALLPIGLMRYMAVKASLINTLIRILSKYKRPINQLSKYVEMTAEELAKVKFKSTGHIAFSDEHQCLYSNEQYGFNLAIVTRMNRDGMVDGRSRRWYQYKGKWYGTLKKFLEAIKDVEFINNI